MFLFVVWESQLLTHLKNFLALYIIINPKNFRNLTGTLLSIALRFAGYVSTLFYGWGLDSMMKIWTAYIIKYYNWLLFKVFFVLSWQKSNLRTPSHVGFGDLVLVVAYHTQWRLVLSDINLKIVFKSFYPFVSFLIASSNLILRNIQLVIINQILSLRGNVIVFFFAWEYSVKLWSKVLPFVVIKLIAGKTLNLD